MRLFTWGVVLLVWTSSNPPQSQTPFCDLLRNPEKYNGKDVIVRATYRYSFEVSQLHCLDCQEKGRVWLAMPISLEDTSSRSLKKMPKGAGIVNLTVEGVFESGGTYGHENGYRYQIEPNKISDVVVLQKGIKHREQQERVEKRWACGGADPK